MIVVDGVFSMEGDSTPCPRSWRPREFDAAVMVATPTESGLGRLPRDRRHYGLEDDVDS